MQYTSHYCSPIGDILLAADDIGLTGLWFEGQNILRFIWTNSMRKKKFPFLKK